MGALKNISGVLHHIRCKLYPNNLPNSGGPYLARTNNEASLSVEQVCASLKSRGGFHGSYEQLIEHVKQYLDEAAYQLCDGFAVNSGYYTIYPKIGGTFESADESYDPKKNPLSFHFRANPNLKDLVNHISIDIEGLAEVSGYISSFVDTDSEVVNSGFTAGNIFRITGYKIKIEGDSPDVGIYFVPVDAPAKAVKVKRVADNNSVKLVGVIPKVSYPQCRIEVRTQFSGSNNLLKEPRIITSKFILEAS